MKAVNTKVSMDQFVLQSLYFQYKDFITPVGVIFVCLLTCWIVILPQIQNWFTMQDQIVTDTQQLSILKQNLNAVTLMNDGNLDMMLQTASSALPTDKDFAAIVNALSTSALQAGTQLGDYNFQIGDLTDVNTGDSSAPVQLPRLQLVIILPGNLSTTKAFVANLKNQLPLSDVTSISQNADSTVTVTVIFYYAPLPKISFNDSVPLQVVSGKDEAFLKSLSSNSNLQQSLSVIPTPSISQALVTGVPTPSVTISPTPATSSAVTR